MHMHTFFKFPSLSLPTFNFPVVKNQLRWLLALSVFATAPLFGQILNFDFSSSAGSLIAFDGTTKTISFTGGGSFGISDSSGSLLGLNALQGNITPASPFAVGTISPVDVNETDAPVSGPAAFSITDSLGHAITATLTLGDVDVWNPGPSYGAVNTVGAVNLLSFSGYTGTDPRLAQLAGRSAVFSLDFQFANPGPSLAQLMADGASSTTSFNGTVSLVAVPEPPYTALGLSAASLLMIGWLRRNQPALV